ncbi:MAG: hypothetical protein HY360_26700 [Verrucomicrobia bacterium]|nr:hypothetical protein [Verrucomicrobiota bacterium]
MRTTLDIEDDVLEAARELAEREGSTSGRVLSTLARQGSVVQSSEVNIHERFHALPPNCACLLNSEP